MFSNENNHLTDESLNPIHFWTKLWAHQDALIEDPQQVSNLVDLVESVHRGWSNAAIECAQYRELNQRLKQQNEKYEQALDEARKEMNCLHSKQAADQARIVALQDELDQYKERFNAAKATMQNAPLVVPSILETPSNSDTDTALSGERPSGKRRSNSLGVLPDKRAKRLLERENFEGLIEEDQDESPHHQSQLVTRQRTMNRSLSESRIFEDKKGKPAEHKQMPAKFTTTSTMDIRLSPMIGFGSGWTKGRPVEQCGHSFVAHNNLFSAAFSYCSVCTRSLGMRGLKCNAIHGIMTAKFLLLTDCKLQLHENCRQNAPIPCVPIVLTPQRNNPKQRPRLADFCPDSQPKIPGQIIRCVVALELGFIHTVGLYRVPGCDSEIRRLKDNFASKYVPKLDQMDPETITGFIKKFLRDIREPLIPYSSFKEFYMAVASKNEDQLKYAIETLPIPNRDTLAYLCAHWQKVAMRSNENQMPLENLAKVLGPTVVGTASKLNHLTHSPRLGIVAGTSANVGNSGDAYRHYMEANKQVEILLALLRLNHEYWTDFYNISTLQQQPCGSGTPKRGHAIHGTANY